MTPVPTRSAQASRQPCALKSPCRVDRTWGSQILRAAHFAACTRYLRYDWSSETQPVGIECRSAGLYSLIGTARSEICCR